jgi:hypothetical protein
MPKTVKKSGFTLVGALVTLAILSGLFAILGKALPFMIRSRLRAESKASFSKSAGAISGMVARRVAQVLEMACPNPSDSGDQRVQTFINSFNTSAPMFPGTQTSLVIESGPDAPGLAAFPAPPVSKPKISAGLAACKTNTGLSIPAPSQSLPYIFCLSLSRPEGSNLSTLTDFIDSKNAFLQVRVELFSQDDSQEMKVLGQSRSCPSYQSLPFEKRQIKINYEGFWKKTGDDSDAAFFSFGNSSVLNRNEIP